jgi:hypothetical protein
MQLFKCAELLAWADETEPLFEPARREAHDCGSRASSSDPPASSEAVRRRHQTRGLRPVLTRAYVEL